MLVLLNWPKFHHQSENDITKHNNRINQSPNPPILLAGWSFEVPRVLPTFSSTKDSVWQTWPGTMPSPGIWPRSASIFATTGSTEPATVRTDYFSREQYRSQTNIAVIIANVTLDFFAGWFPHYFLISLCWETMYIFIWNHYISCVQSWLIPHKELQNVSAA